MIVALDCSSWLEVSCACILQKVAYLVYLPRLLDSPTPTKYRHHPHCCSRPTVAILTLLTHSLVRN